MRPRGDAASSPRHPIGRAMREAEPARDARRRARRRRRRASCREHVPARVEAARRVEQRPGSARVRSATTGSTGRGGLGLRCGGRRRRRPRRRTCPSSAAISVGEIDQRCGGRAGGPSVGTSPDAEASASTSAGCPSSSDPRPRAVPQDRAPAGTAPRRAAAGSAVSTVNQRDAAGIGRVRKITSPMSPTVPSEPTSSRHRS